MPKPASPETVLISPPAPHKKSRNLKTADRILDTARRLFNERGERNVTASDIALELDISPGNLYYHFKGTDSIHPALFTQLQRELVSLLGAPIQSPELFAEQDGDSAIERSWLFLTVILEKILEYRYLYANPNDLGHRFPDIERGFRRLVKLKRAACEAIGKELIGSALTGPSDPKLERLVDAMTLTLTYWVSFDQLNHPADADAVVVHRGVLQLLSFCAPYLGDEQQAFYAECEQLYRQMLASDDF